MSDIVKNSSIPVYAVLDTSGSAHVLKMREIPLIGDTIIIVKKGVFKVTERGQIADTTNPSWGWVRLKDVQDPAIAPGSDMYRFMEKFPSGES